jgi:hypothetical protein
MFKPAEILLRMLVSGVGGGVRAVAGAGGGAGAEAVAVGVGVCAGFPCGKPWKCVGSGGAAVAVLSTGAAEGNALAVLSGAAADESVAVLSAGAEAVDVGVAAADAELKCGLVGASCAHANVASARASGRQVSGLNLRTMDGRIVQ